jgi:hypothetical protein
MGILPDTFYRSNGNPPTFRSPPTLGPGSNWNRLHADKPEDAVPYPFAFDFLRLRRCAFFFLCLLAILFTECLLRDRDGSDEGPFALVSSIFSSCTSDILFLL